MTAFTATAPSDNTHRHLPSRAGSPADEPDASPGTVLTTWHDDSPAAEALLSIVGLSACEDRADGRLLLVLIDDRVDAGDLLDTALDAGAVWAGLGGNGRWSVQEDTWWREPVPGTEGLDDATLGAILFGDDEDVAGTAESAPGRRLDPASLTFATDLLQDPAPGRRSRGAGVLCTSYEVARATGRRVPPAVLETLLEALRTETDLEPTVIATLRHLLDDTDPRGPRLGHVRLRHDDRHSRGGRDRAP